MKLYAMRVIGFMAAALLTANAVSAQVPTTPAGRQFSAWLEAFNSGDRERIRRFLETNYPSVTVDAQLNFRDRTGGFDFRKLEEGTTTTLTGLVQERNSDQFARFNLVVDATDPYKITRLALGAIPRPA